MIDKEPKTVTYTQALLSVNLFFRTADGNSLNISDIVQAIAFMFNVPVEQSQKDFVSLGTTLNNPKISSNNVTLFQYVTYKGMRCIVTNAFVCGGKEVQVSPVGNGNSPAKYYIAKKDEVTPL